DYYYEHLDFDASSDDARRLSEVLDKLVYLLNDQRRSKIIGHEAIHLVLLVDALLDDYTRSWEQDFAAAFDWFRAEIKAATQTRYDSPPSEFWINYGVGTRVNSDRGDVIQRRHEFFVEKMKSKLKLQLKDPQRTYGTLERELIYFRERKKCFECSSDVPWNEAEIHHVKRHSDGGRTSMDNGALVHRHCHPKSATAEAALAQRWKERQAQVATPPSGDELLAARDLDDDEVL
ncbi:MAG TPA: HNH endonuclease signature motif containing protein, partial [Xanthobacteraceae bacterium]|nr:HNH endonuclease signature motif containing protein [Xanthobacteraceae bacterium]